MENTSGTSAELGGEMVFAWVGGWIYSIPKSHLDDAIKNNLAYIRPATDEQVEKLLGNTTPRKREAKL